ncbi:alpha/beta hydrolase [Anaerosporobacter faecicola]|uniref:alpha/beta hydrolase n=1 Tax=Anaerosporobacter faecicola TaxID=2718714 RepID=UPI001438DA68|nr:alpha/beta hydrolase [Anaerosporobacter faecicola]
MSQDQENSKKDKRWGRENVNVGNPSKKRHNKKKIIGITLGSIFAVLVAAVLGASYYFGYQVAQGLLYQNEGNDTKNNSVEQLNLWGYDQNEYVQETFEQNNHGTQFTAKAKDGNIVYGTHFIGENTVDNNTVILVHGAGGDRVCMEPLAKMYLEHGWNVITMDQRASGESTNKKVSFGYFEKYDIQALVDYVEECTTDKQIVVHGQSMGAVTTGLYASTKHAKEHVDAVIMDSPFDSMRSMFLGVWHEMEDSKGVPDDYIIWCGDWYLRWNEKFGFADADLVKQSKKNTVKSLVIESLQDDVATPAMCEAVYEAIGTNEKSLWKVDAKHVEGFVDYPEEYTKAVMEFLEN